jgi:hypothetical protein
MTQEDECPIFEITDLGGKNYRIWASGRIEGFEDMPGPCVVINRIPATIYRAMEEARDARRT